MTNERNRTIYQRWAPFYDAILGRIYRPGRRRALHALGVQPGERVLLPGIGTGEDLAFLPPQSWAVGVDLSPHMLARARSKLRQGGAQVTLLCGDAHCLPLKSESFDAAVLNLILSVVPDGRLCLQSTLRVLKPGGRLVIFDKFLPRNKISRLRRAFNFFTTRIGTDINRRLEDMSAGLPCQVVYEDSNIAWGMYRILVMRRTSAGS